MIEYEQALELLLQESQPLGAEKVPLARAFQRRLYEPQFAHLDSPRIDNSRVDGYSVRLQDLPKGNRVTHLPIAFESRAGSIPINFPLESEGCARVSTGAPIPLGHDAVIMQEDVMKGEGTISFDKSLARQMNIRKCGEDFRTGSCLAPKGTVMDAGMIALLAQGGTQSVSVFSLPKVSLLVNGDEIVCAGDNPVAADELPLHQIPESISSAIGCELTALGLKWSVSHAGDDPKVAVRAVQALAEEADILLSTGGVSVGDHDHVKTALLETGFQMVFWQVNVKPGKPTCFFTRTLGTRKQYALGLPGNPVSALTMLQVFGVPLIRAVTGAERTTCFETSFAVLGRDLTPSGSRLEFVRGTLACKNGQMEVLPMVQRESHQLRGFAGANCLIQLPPGETLQAGSLVQVSPISSASLSQAFSRGFNHQSGS